MGDFIPYPAIERHGLVGDRRTAALIASDGTVDWMCLPNYDGHVVFGAALDSCRGGFWRVGPSTLWSGEQSYPTAAPVLRTRWAGADYELELLDAMILPGERDDATADQRVLLRCLRCARGAVDCVSIFAPSLDFTPIDPDSEGRLAELQYEYWCSDAALQRARGTRRMNAGDVIWMAFSVGRATAWTVEAAQRALDAVERYWGEVLEALGGRSLDPRLVRSAITIRQLEYAPAGSIVAAPTTSLPERIGGGWNADYRLTWVRDASIALATLASFGDLTSPRRYFDWLATRDSVTDAPLQVVYEIDGGTSPRQHERHDLDGYRGSKPLRFGNHAYRQRQHDSFGYLADCALMYLEHGGEWDPRLWDLLTRSADWVVKEWRTPGNGIWELSVCQQYISGRVMSWVVLDRVLRIAERAGLAPVQADTWRRTASAIADDVLRNGWSESLGAFKQSIETEALDASALLIPVFGFLPIDDPRVVSTITRIAERLTIDGCVYRFDPPAIPDVGQSPLGEYEAAFLPCTFWLATAFAMLGRDRDAADVLRAAESVAGGTGLFAEAIDPREATFRGNSPLLFSHVEYVRAVRALSR